MKFRIDDEVQSLQYFKALINFSKKIVLLNTLEIEPFDKFNLEFGNVYWYFKYLLLRDKKIILYKEDINEEYLIFFLEKNLNIVSIYMSDENNYDIKCTDGIFYIKIINDDLLLMIENNKNWVRV